MKNHALTVNIFITYEEISYSCEDRGIQKYLEVPTFQHTKGIPCESHFIITAAILVLLLRSDFVM